MDPSGLRQGDISKRSDVVVPLIAAGLLMAVLGTLYSWSVFVQYVEAELGQSRGPTSVIFAIAIICFTLGMLLAPRFNKVRSLAEKALFACALAAIGLTIAGLGSSYGLVVLGFGVIFGLANGLGYSLSLQIIQSAPTDNLGLLTGITVASYMMGSVLGTPLLEVSLDTLGFRRTVLLLGGTILISGFVIYMLLNGIDRVVGSPAIEGRRSFPSLMTFWLLWSCFLFSSFVGMMIIGHAAPIVASLGGTRAEITLAVTLTSAGNAVGRLGGGWLTDHFPSTAVLAGAPALSFVGLMVTFFVRRDEIALLSLCLIGIAYGCIASALPSILAKCYGVENVSNIYGKLFTAWGTAGLLGPVAAGVLFDSFGSYSIALLAAVGAAGAAMITGWLSAGRLRLPGYLRRRSGS
jgi:MFS transporter, OFA family, oxalate/formate antiporter